MLELLRCDAAACRNLGYAASNACSSQHYIAVDLTLVIVFELHCM
jgi:hypothetical protein